MIIGVTGTLASGKSTAARTIADIKRGVLIDADNISHYVLDNDRVAYRNAVSYFGKAILDDNGAIDRKKLAEIVFSDRKKLKALCDILHPQIINRIKKQTNASLDKNKNAFIVIDAPLLLEAHLKEFCDITIVISASIENILSRARRHNGLEKPEALRRVRAQMPISEKKRHTDYVIENDGTIEELKDKVKQLMAKITP